MIETKQLRILKTIADVGSFTAAGEQLGISQPAISQQIRGLEDQLGVPLFARVGKATRITPAGEVLLHCANQILEKLQETERRLEEQARGRSGLVRIGTPEPPCNYILPQLLIEMKRRFPSIDARVISGHSADTLARLTAGEIDLALLPLPLQRGKLWLAEVAQDELVAIVPPGHNWTGMPFVGARDFERQPMVVYDRASQITDLTLGFLLNEGIFPRVAVEIDHLEAVKDLVQRRIGVAVVPQWAARREIDAGTLIAVRVGPSGLRRSWGVLHANQQPFPATMRALVQLFIEKLPEQFASEDPSNRGSQPFELAEPRIG